jgi:lauroyl/myristoyl acyltransferase
MTADSTAVATVTARRARPNRRTLRGRATALALRALSAVLKPLPDGPLHRVAHVLGGILYRVQPARRRLVRANLERVVTWLAAQGLGGERTRAAADDPRQLDRLVRQAFGHYVRAYLEGSILPAYAAPQRLDRVQPEDPAAVVRAFAATTADGQPRPLIIVGLHFGAIEIPALWATKKLGRRITAPMETIPDPDVQSYFERSRGATGLTVIPMERAATPLRAALARGETVALVADRAIGGSGTAVELFGAPARLPIGPAVLALETGAPVWVVATRRVGWNAYSTRLEELEMPSDGPRRQRLVAFMASQARAFERAIADAPEQWWSLFFPIWDDIRP